MRIAGKGHAWSMACQDASWGRCWRRAITAGRVTGMQAVDVMVLAVEQGKPHER